MHIHCELKRQQRAKFRHICEGKREERERKRERDEEKEREKEREREREIDRERKTIRKGGENKRERKI